MSLLIAVDRCDYSPMLLAVDDGPLNAVIEAQDCLGRMAERQYDAHEIDWVSMNVNEWSDLGPRTIMLQDAQTLLSHEHGPNI